MEEEVQEREREREREAGTCNIFFIRFHILNVYLGRLVYATLTLAAHLF